MDDSETQNIFEMIVVTIAVQQGVPLAKAKRSDQTIDGLADGVSPLTEGSEVSRGFDSQFLTASLKDLELAKFTQDSRERLLVAHTLKSLAENEIRQSEALATKLAVKVVGLSVPQTAQIVDLQRRINDHHGTSSPSIARDEICEGFRPSGSCLEAAEW